MLWGCVWFVGVVGVSDVEAACSWSVCSGCADGFVGVFGSGVVVVLV